MKYILSLAASLALLCCTEPSSRPPSAPTSQREAQLLEAAGRCLQEDYASFAGVVEALATATEQLVASPDDQGRWAEARSAWEAAIDRWQELEPRHLGPAASATTPGGQNLREEVYSWPLISRCSVEQTLVNQGYLSPDFAALSLVNARGMAALEYLLFFEGTDNACGPQVKINTDGSWAAIDAAELRRRKAAYARSAAADVLRRARTLADAWAPGKGNFSGTLASAGPENSTFSSAQIAFNTISDVLLTQLDQDTKDRKVGRPLGLVDCTGACLDGIESRFSKNSKKHVLANLRGARKVLVGCGDGSGSGLDELLRARGAGDLATRVEQVLDAATQAAEGISPDDLETAIGQNRPSVEASHTAIKNLTDVLRNEFVLVLGLQLPALVAGDND